MKRILGVFVVAIITLGSILALKADVRTPAIFGDHMVLQQEATLPVWGWATAGEKITVSFGDKKVSTSAGADGKWRADLPALPSGTPAGTLVVAGNNTLTFTDVLVGDVWLCSGQSNMEFSVKKLAINQVDAAQATDSQIRLFHVPHKLAITPVEDVVAKWEVCSPDTLADFTAVGFFFAKDLLPVVKHPVGLIESSWGATTAQAWTSLDGFKADPSLQHFADEHDTALTNYPGGEADFEAKVAAYDDATKQWNDSLTANTAYQDAKKEWSKANAAAQSAGQPSPPSPPLPAPQPHFPPGGHHNAPAALFDAMIHPLIPYAIKGVIWYQGEDNSKTLDSALGYRVLFPAMITDWRNQWKEGDFPFLFVQLAGFTQNPKSAGEVSLKAIVRESQAKTLALRNTGMAVAADIGSVENIHPPDKFDVAQRLSLAARHVAYGETLVYTGPVYDSMQTTGSTVKITFKADSLGGGLVIGKPPVVDPKAAPVSTTDLQGFALAGEDKNWFWATAKIDQHAVLVSSPDVPKPVAVRYGWASNPTCNLYNTEGLPAVPFRTDDWTVSADEAAKAATLMK